MHYRWSVGVLTYILLSGLSPFGGENDDETLRNVKACDWNMDDPAFEAISPAAKDFIAALLRMEPERRLNVHATLEHPWLAERVVPQVEPAMEIPSNR